METYSLLRQFADSWMLLVLFAFFIGVVIWVFRPVPRKTYENPRTSPSGTKTNRHRRRCRRQGGVRHGQETNKKQEPETTGHEWDGIQEYNNPLPRWWLWTFYACIVWGSGMSIAYPAWPLINEATAGYKGWSTRANVAEEIAEAEEANAEINARLASVELTAIPADPELHGYATSAGAAVFEHLVRAVPRLGGGGRQGLSQPAGRCLALGRHDGGHPLHRRARHPQRGRPRRALFADARLRRHLLEPEEIDQVVNYVMSLSGEPQDAALVAGRARPSTDNCAACHGERRRGRYLSGRAQPADAIWLYGGDYDTMKRDGDNSRFRRDAADGRGRSERGRDPRRRAYVHQLGGGE